MIASFLSLLSIDIQKCEQFDENKPHANCFVLCREAYLFDAC